MTHIRTFVAIDLDKQHHIKSRIESIDLLRGIVMIIMAIDHIRDYFHYDAYFFSPTDIKQTTTVIFFTRWITHLCAPAFIFLAGISAYFIRQQKSKKETTLFLLTRGFWLIVLQFTVIRFAWSFDPLFHYNAHAIISDIGLCMMLLAALIYLPWNAILVVSLMMIVGHNMLDGVSFSSGTAAVIWSLLHVNTYYDFGNGYSFEIFYPIIPWIGIMALGYCLGRLFDREYSSDYRKMFLLRTGIVSLVLLLLLRYSNFYGDPLPWSIQTEWSKTLLSFLNFRKYPPSLFYAGVMLGISLILLGMMEGKNLNRWKPVILFGKVALFYYVIHILVIHIFAMITAVLSGLPWQTMIFTGPIKDGSILLKGKFGFSIGYVYVVWIAVILFLYPVCVYWNDFKIRHKGKWWVSYV
jgi:uncharacterized membrane protein